MRKERVSKVVGAIVFIAVLVAAYYLSLGVVRLYSKVSGEPNPQEWEWVIVSKSPNAECYHQSKDCKYLKKSNYDSDVVSVEEAEEERGLRACNYCINNYKVHRYDRSAWVVFTPVVLLLFVPLALFDVLKKKYCLRSPIVKRGSK